jgi:hypothetical protein
MFFEIRTEQVLTPTSAPPDYTLNFQNTLEYQVQNAFNVWLPMKNPTQMPALLHYLQEEATAVHEVLASLHYIHFARFMPSPDGTIIWVITEYDGGVDSYIMDFVGLIGDQFNEILQFIHEAPRLPVQRYAPEFIDYIKAHNLPVSAWSAYPANTVIDIKRSARRA